MKNWMLVCCCERDIEHPRFFETKEEAVYAMCADVGDVLGMTPEEVMETRLNGTEINLYAIVGDDYAWSDRHVPCDWKVFDISWATMEE